MKFPVPEPFTFRSREEVIAYTAGDTVTCLICGKDFRALATHVRQTHDMTARDYKLRFGLPTKRSLTAAPLREKNSARTTQRNHQEGLAAKMLQARRQLPNPSPGTVIQPPYVRLEQQTVTASDIRKIMAYIRQGDGVRQACERPDCVSTQGFYTFLREHPKMKREYERMIDALPFSQQARMEMLGQSQRFRKAIEKTRHLPAQVAAKKLGVHLSSVNKIRREMASASPPIVDP